jgi:hypothetical protein
MGCDASGCEVWAKMGVEVALICTAVNLTQLWRSVGRRGTGATHVAVHGVGPQKA